MSLPAIAWALLSLVGVLNPFVSMFEGSPPSRAAIVTMLADFEAVPPSDISQYQHGYLILRPYEGLPPQALTEVRVLDDEGSELHSPIWW